MFTVCVRVCVCSNVSEWFFYPLMSKVGHCLNLTTWPKKRKARWKRWEIEGGEKECKEERGKARREVTDERGGRRKEETTTLEEGEERRRTQDMRKWQEGNKREKRCDMFKGARQEHRKERIMNRNKERREEKDGRKRIRAERGLWMKSKGEREREQISIFLHFYNYIEVPRSSLRLVIFHALNIFPQNMRKLFGSRVHTDMQWELCK